MGIGRSIPLSVLAEQGLDRRMESQKLVRSEVAAWEAERNRTEAKVRWRFTTEKARIKLEKLRGEMVSFHISP